MNTLAERIKYTREKLRMSQESFAEALGVNQSNITLWEKGKYNPRRDKQKQIADLAGVSLSWLMTGEGTPDGSQSINSGEGIEIPRYQSLFDYIRGIEETFMFVSSVGIKSNYIAVRVDSDAMSPKIEPGDILIIDPDVACYPGDVVIYITKDRQFIRELLEERPSYKFKAWNERYPAQIVPKSEIVKMSKCVAVDKRTFL